MQKKLFFLFISALLMSSILLGQTSWKKFFTSPPYSSFANDVVETYDKGYAFEAAFKDIAGPWYGWIVKTDINGNKLWDIIIDGHKNSDLICLNKTIDGGFIAGGRYDIFRIYTMPM